MKQETADDTKESQEVEQGNVVLNNDEPNSVVKQELNDYRDIKQEIIDVGEPGGVQVKPESITDDDDADAHDDDDDDAHDDGEIRSNPLLLNTGGRPHICQHCSYSAARKYNLLQHIERVHLRLKPHSCGDCSKSFYTKQDLSRHLLTHRGGRPHICQHCSNSYARKDTLVTHIQRVHLRLKPHSCGDCSKSFYSKHSLSEHLLTHTVERPHSCVECSDSYATSTYLVEHIKRVHLQIKPHSCVQFVIGSFSTALQFDCVWFAAFLSPFSFFEI